MPATTPLPGRGIDHLVLCVRDLDSAASVYERLGFTLTPRASHDWGTDNRLAQFQGNFLEIVEIAHPKKIPAPAPGRFHFGTFIQSYLQDREGLGLLVFESGDARADREEFAGKGLSDFEPFDFERQALLPDGSSVTVGFSLAFVSPPDMPDAAFFVCQQQAPQYFWKPAYQKHSNGAQAVGQVVMVAEDPAQLAPLFEGLQQPGSTAQENGTLHVETARGWLSAMTPGVYSDWFGEAKPAGVPARGPHFAAYRVLVDDLAAVQSHLDAEGFSYNWGKAGLVVGPEQLFGVALAFVQGGGSAAPQAGLPLAF